MPGIYLDDDELDAMRGLPHLARVLYVEELRRRMDFKTGMVGARPGNLISWRALCEAAYVDPHSGPVQRAPGREQVRRAVGWLERAGLAQLRGSRNALQLIFFLPKARLSSHVQEQPDRNPTGYPDRGSTQRKPTVSRQQPDRLTRQTSEYRESPIYQAAAATLYGDTDLVFPQGSPQVFTQAQRNAVVQIARRAALTRNDAQLLLDELIAKMKAERVLNPPRFFAALVEQLRAGTFDGTGAAAVRAGGKALSDEEVRLASREEIES